MDRIAELLGRFFMDMDITREEAAVFTEDEWYETLEDFLEERPTPRMVEAAMSFVAATEPEGIEGRRLDYIPAQEIWRWRDVVTGRFTTPATGFFRSYRMTRREDEESERRW